MKPKGQELRDLIAFLKTLLPKGRIKPPQKPAKETSVFHPRFGIDYAWGNPSVKGLKNAGVTFVCRYLSPAGNSKNLRRGERRALAGARVDIVTVWETTAERARAGFDAGKHDAELAKAALRDLGAPAHAVVYFAVDFDDERAPVGDYFKGAAHVLGVERVGVYGGYAVVKRLLNADLARFAWQTYAWSGGAWDHRAHLRQFSNDHTIAGVSCDFDRAVAANFGQWR